MIEVKLRTLTPIWTGNMDRDSPSLKDTGLLGSLRFWYEAWVRALGGLRVTQHLKINASIKKKLVSVMLANFWLCRLGESSGSNVQVLRPAAVFGDIF